MDWRRAGGTTGNKQTSSASGVQRGKLLKLQVRSQKPRLQECSWFCKGQWATQNYCMIPTELVSRPRHLLDCACVLSGLARTSPGLSSCLCSPGGGSKAVPKTCLQMPERCEHAGEHSSGLPLLIRGCHWAWSQPTTRPDHLTPGWQGQVLTVYSSGHVLHTSLLSLATFSSS